MKAAKSKTTAKTAPKPRKKAEPVKAAARKTDKAISKKRTVSSKSAAGQAAKKAVEKKTPKKKIIPKKAVMSGKQTVAAKKPVAKKASPETKKPAKSAAKVKKAVAIKAGSPRGSVSAKRQAAIKEKKSAVKAVAKKPVTKSPVTTGRKTVAGKKVAKEREIVAAAKKPVQKKISSEKTKALKAPAKAVSPVVRTRPAAVKKTEEIKATAKAENIKKSPVKKMAAAKKETALPAAPPARPATLKRSPAVSKTDAEYRAAAGYEPVAEEVASRPALKIFLPEDHLPEEEQDVYFAGLPGEYGENSVIAMAVDPNSVFVDWEIIPGDIAGEEGDLNLRFYDVTGIEFNSWKANCVLDIRIKERVGNGFFDIHMPGRDVIVAAGIMSPVTGFRPIVRSEKVSIPELLSFDELGIVQKLFESGIPVGY